MFWLIFSCVAEALLSHSISSYGSVGPWSQRLPVRHMCDLNNNTRYFLYGVNPLEGFSARRKVFLRAAYLTLLLEGNWTLVLPPFRQLQHWPYAQGRGAGLPWRDFFDVDALSQVLSVIEWEDYVALHGSRVDLAIWLESARLTNAELNNNTVMTDPFRVFGLNSCPRQPDSYHLSTWKRTAKDMTHRWKYFDPSSYGEFLAKQRLCATTNGRILEASAILSKIQQVQSLFLDRIETTAWDRFWESPLFHQLLNAQRFAPHLGAKAKEFMDSHLAGGYIAVHIRGGDFVYHHPSSVLSIEAYATRLRKEMKSRGLSSVFIATNMDESQRKQLAALVPCTFLQGFQQLHPGQLAIIEQLICVHAEHFIGTRESFFTTTIQEERNKIHKNNGDFF